MITKMGTDERKKLIPLMADCRYDRVIIESVLEGRFGEVAMNSTDTLDIIRLDSGAFTLLYGDANHESADELIGSAPVYYVTPQNKAWEERLKAHFKESLNPLSITVYTPESLKRENLEALITGLPPEYTLMKIDAANAEKTAAEIGNEYFFENFHSLEDYLTRGLGFSIEYNGTAVAAATSMAQCSSGIDIEIETAPDHLRKGLGSAVGAKLVLACLERGLTPHWLAANAESGKLARKLGFTRGETYITFEILE